MASLPPAHASAAAAPRTDERTSSLPLGSNSNSKFLDHMTRVEDDGLALTDEALLLVFAASSLDIVDLLHCAATCRGWRRLVTTDADFICRHKPDHDDLAATALAVGFFHQRRDTNSSALPLQFFPSLVSRCASLDALLGGDLLRDDPRLIASRNGRLLLELRRGAAALRLVVCNTVTGGVLVLPALSGKDRPKRYACALLLSTDDSRSAVRPLLRRLPTAFRVVLVYMRAYSMVCRSCSSGADSSWGAEREVSGASISGKKLGELDAGVAVGGAVFWLSGKVVFGLHLDTLQWTVESPRGYGIHRFVGSGHGQPLYPADCRLAALPDGRLGAVQVGRGGDAGKFVMNIFARNDGRRKDRWVWEEDARDVDLESLLPPSVSGGGGAARSVRLRAVCESSGLVFLAAMRGGGHGRGRLYALDLEKKKVQLVPVPGLRPGGCCFRRPSSCSFHGCNMNRVAVQ